MERNCNLDANIQAMEVIGSLVEKYNVRRIR
jgi:hypothetical protein